MSRKSSQDSLAGGDYRLHSDQSGENFRSSSSNLDPKMAVEQARQAKIAAKQRRKEAKELLKRELEAKAKEQAEESERQQQAKQPKPKKEKKVSKEQPEDDSKPPMRQLTTQGSWKISTGEEAEKLANEADHNKPAVILESMEPILEDAASKDNDTDPKWNMKLTASPTKDNHSSAVAESPVRVEKTHTEVVADHVEDVKESAAELPVEDKAEKETPTVDDQSALAQFSKLQEEATHVEETPAVVDAAPTEQLAEPEKVIAHEESADHTKKEEEDNAQLPEATVKQDTIQETIAPVQEAPVQEAPVQEATAEEATAEEESKPTEVPVVEGDKPEEAAATDNVETEGNPENKESS